MVIQKKQEVPSWYSAWVDSFEDPYLFATGVLGFLPYGEDNPDNQPQLEKWQDEFLREFFIGPDGKPHKDVRHSIRAGHGVGKFQPKTEPVLTPNGWAEIGSLNLGDRVATIDGSFTTITGIYPQGEKPVFKIVLDDGTSTLAGEDHLWFTTTRSERKHGKPGNVRTTAEIAQSLTFPNGPREGLNHCLPRLSRAIQHPEADLPVDPYLMGVYLGDGTHAGVLSLNVDDTDHYAEYISQFLKKSGLFVTYKDKGYKTLNGRLKTKIIEQLYDLGLKGKLAPDKFIPEVYLYASAEQRLALLQGLMDTDGTPGSNNNAATFDTSSKQLADGLSELVRSLGGVARRGGRQGRYNGMDKLWSHRVFVALPEGTNPFLCPRKADRYNPFFGHKNKDRTLSRFIVAVEESGVADCVCISVAHPSKLYITKDHIPTHNTVVLAILALWWILTRCDSKCIITASTQNQLRDVDWAELRKWAGHLPKPLYDQLQIDQERMYIKSAPEMAFIVRRTANKSNPESLQGFHAKHILFLMDEASGIDNIVFEVAQGAFSTEGASSVMVSNPTRPDGFFFDTHHRLRDRWRCWQVSSQDVPRAVGHIEDVIAAYGRNSNKFKVRVEGNFPTSADDVVIPLEWVQSAVNRDVEKLSFFPIWGVDVARFGDDASALAKRQANRLLEPVKEWLNLDTMQLTGRIHHEYVNTHEDFRPKEILVDVIGIGAGVVDRCRELGLPVRGVNVAESPSSVEKCMRLRDELWWLAREWFQERACCIPDDQKLIAQLIGPTYDFHSNGKIVVESKKDMKERSLKSPDCFPAGTMVLTPSGDVPIEHLKEGDEVITPWAVRRIIKTHKNTTEALATVYFNDGKTLIGTPNHSIFTWDKGWVRLDALSVINEVESASISRRLKWLGASLFFTGGKSSGLCRTVSTINQGERMTRKGYCIAASGAISMAPFRKATISTTKMAIGAIMRSTILPLWGPLSMQECTGRSGFKKIGITMRKIWSKRGRPQRPGTGLMESEAGIIDTRTLRFVTTAAGNSHPTSRLAPDGALRLAHQIPIIGNLSTIKESVTTAVRSFWRTVTGRHVIVPEHVQIEIEKKPVDVYNITLDEDNVYYANGILVKNCADALCLTFAGMALRKVPQKRVRAEGGMNPWAA